MQCAILNLGLHAHGRNSTYKKMQSDGNSADQLPNSFFKVNIKVYYVYIYYFILLKNPMWILDLCICEKTDGPRTNLWLQVVWLDHPTDLVVLGFFYASCLCIMLLLNNL